MGEQTTIVLIGLLKRAGYKTAAFTGQTNT